MVLPLREILLENAFIGNTLILTVDVGYFNIYTCNVVMCVGRTHTIVRLKARIRRKDGAENFGGFVLVLDLV